jgi:tellurite resistance protein TerC
MGIHVDTLFSLLVTVSILAGGVIFSLYKTRNEPAVGLE